MLFLFCTDSAATVSSTLSLHDALPISHRLRCPVAKVRHRLHARDPREAFPYLVDQIEVWERLARIPDRKSTRLNSSHSQISYAVFCLKKKNEQSTDLIMSNSYLRHAIL